MFLHLPCQLKFENKLNVDRNIDASWKIELLKLVHRLCRWLNDVDQTLVCALFELIHRLLVDVRRTIDRNLFDARRQRNRTGNPGS